MPAAPPWTAVLERAAARARLPLTRPRPPALRRTARPTITHREATAHLAARGWRFKRQPDAPPAGPDRIARAVDDLERSADSGSPLAEKPRTAMEEVFDRDFGNVRVHRASLEPLNVQAATKGRDVYLEPGQESFDTPESLALLGHELAHVSQASPVRTRPLAQMAVLPQVQRQAVDEEESAAEETEQTVLNLFRSGTPSSLVASPTAEAPPPGELVVQRQPPPDERETLTAVEGHRQETIGELEEWEEDRREEEEEEAAEVEEVEEEEVEEVAPDLDRLARQVYPFIKRLMAVERERMAR